MTRSRFVCFLSFQAFDMDFMMIPDPVFSSFMRGM